LVLIHFLTVDRTETVKRPRTSHFGNSVPTQSVQGRGWPQWYGVTLMLKLKK